MAKVGIVMGSDSDMPVMAKAADILEKLGIDYEMTIISAHREPDELIEWTRGACDRDVKVIIAGAGMAAALPGMCAAIFPLPVIGVPIHTKSLGGVDSLYSIVQMPSGIPVATVAINGAANAAILAAKMLSISDTALQDKLAAYKEGLKDQVVAKDEKLNKLGNDIYVFDNLKIDIPSDIFIPMTTINNLRRDILKKLTDDRIRVKNNYQKNNVILNKSGIKITNDIFFEVQNKEQLEYILENTDYKCYVNNVLLYSQYKNNDKVIFKMPRINNSNMIKENTLISEIGEITKNTITDTYFNVVNSYYVNFLYNKGVKKVTLSYELTIENIENLIKNYKNKYNEEPNLEVVIYGKPELMISKYCFLNTYVNKEKICNECAKDYYLVDKYNKKFPIRSENCYMKILNYKDINYLDKIDKLQSIGVTNYKIILDRENIEEIKLIISALKIKENIL
mgnify:CR=1 FL=1